MNKKSQKYSYHSPTISNFQQHCVLSAIQVAKFTSTKEKKEEVNQLS